VAEKTKTEPEAEVLEQVEEQGVEPTEAEAPAAAVEVSDETREELEGLRKAVEVAETQAAEYLDGWQRAQAEFSNYKKRQEAERVQMIRLASATLLQKLLPIVDDFERAMGTLPAELSRLTWCEGVFLIKHKLDAVLQSEGVKPIEVEGQMFDPCYHEAVTHEEAPGYEEGQIVGEVQRGYTLGDRVLRPALVRVAKGTEPQTEEDSDSAACENKE
jgi:molecular chaperone GrpE